VKIGISAINKFYRTSAINGIIGFIEILSPIKFSLPFLVLRHGIFFVVLVKHTWICVVGIRYDQCQCILYYAIQVMNSKNKRKKCPEFLIAFNSSGIQMVTCVYTSCFISFISFPACACTIANGRVQSYTTHAPSSPPTMAICQLAS
jgi:hypothetical protein